MRIKLIDLVSSPFRDLMGVLVGKNVTNLIREDDIATGDIVFYEKGE
jgi:hypothetical protein